MSMVSGAMPMSSDMYEAEECDTETSSQSACNGTYPLTNRK